MEIIQPNVKTWKVPCFQDLTGKTKSYLSYVDNPEDHDVMSYQLNPVTRHYDSAPVGRVVMQDNFVFIATLAMVDTYRGRSSAGFRLRDVHDDITFNMRLQMLSDFMKAIQEGRVPVRNGGFETAFTFVKQGSNYSIGMDE